MAADPLTTSLDDLIAQRRKDDTGGKARRDGAMRKHESRKERAAPYSASTVKERRGRGSFRFNDHGQDRGQDRPSQGVGSSSSIYVGNIPWSVEWKEIKTHIAQIANVQRVDIATKPDGRSKGFAIVTMASPHDAKLAIESLHGTDFQGRGLIVRTAQEPSNAPKSGGKGSGKGGGTLQHSESQEEEDGYTHSGSKGRNGWVKPSLENCKCISSLHAPCHRRAIQHV